MSAWAIFSLSMSALFWFLLGAIIGAAIVTATQPKAMGSRPPFYGMRGAAREESRRNGGGGE